MEVEQVTLSEWADVLPADGFEVFHHPDALAVVGEHAQGELRLLGGFKGDQPVGLLPLFVRELPLATAVFSPPPSMGIPRLGPLVMPNSPKQRKRERVNRRFTEAVMDEVGSDGTGTLRRLQCPVGYDDPRPLAWTGLQLEPAFTYLVGTDGDADAVMRRFSKSLRREVRALQDADVTVTVGGLDAARTVYDDLSDRYEEQGETFALEWPYVRDLVEALGERAPVYVARDPEGEFLGGIIVLYSNDAAYFWQGGARATYETHSVNSLLHWADLEELATDPPVPSATDYDLVGANTERLCRYKSKLGGRTVPYYVAETTGLRMSLAKRAYEFGRRPATLGRFDTLSFW
jgi:hypothetical protein